MTKQELRERILRTLNDDPTSPVFWAASEIDDYVQDGQEALAEQSEALRETFALVLTPNQWQYTFADLGPNVQTIYRVYNLATDRRITATTMEELDRRHVHWMTTTGQPKVWFPIDWETFGIFPVPLAADTLEIDCYMWPDVLTLDTDEPAFHLADHEALVFYGEMEGYLKQHMPLQAIDAAQGWAIRQGNADVRNSINQVRGALHARDETG